jgi:hypothetical protein
LEIIDISKQYLKQILSRVRPEDRVLSPLDPLSSGVPSQSTTRSIITAEDLLQAVETSPKVMGEDLSVNLERIGLSL